MTRNAKRTIDCWPNHVACQHRSYIGKHVSLNGKNATICKDSDGWPHVKTMDGENMISFSWMAIYNICDNKGGEFYS